MGMIYKERWTAIAAEYNYKHFEFVHYTANIFFYIRA